MTPTTFARQMMGLVLLPSWPDMRYITRNQANQGWQVRLQSDGGILSRFFSDARFGGKWSARNAAKAWRDETMASLGIQLPPRGQARRGVPRKKSRNNSSGIIGVIRIERLRKGRTGENYIEAGWRAYGMINKKAWSRFYSISKYGECEAFRLACSERYKRQGSIRVVGSKRGLPCALPPELFIS